MSRPAEWCRRIWHLLNRRRFEEVLRCEMDAHRAALDRPTSFGNTLRLRERARDVWGWNWFDDAVRDVRLAARTLRRAPGFAITSVLLLGLGIGVNLALLQVVVAVLVRPQPLRDPATLVRFDRRGPHFTSSQVSYPLARYVGAHNTVLSAVLARSPAQVVWDDGLERIQGAFVSASWFGEFGARAELGRMLGDVDTAPGAPPAVVVSHAFWRRHLDGRPDVVGSPITVNSEPATLVGVVGADFPDVDFGQTSIWMPLRQIAHFVPGSRMDTDWTDDIDMYARLRPGVSREAARDGLAAVLASLRQAEPAHVEAGEWLNPYLGTERFSSPRDAQQAWTAATAVMVLVVLVLLVACLNLSNLAFARAMSRLREMSIRVGLGAGRWRVMRHVLSESALVSICGGVAGVLLSMGALRLLAHFETPVSHLDLSFDWRMGLATLAAVALALAAVGLVPAWKIGGADLALATRDGGERLSMGLHESRLRLSLVAGQIAGTCLLLVFTAQLARSVQRALSSDLGYDFSRVVVFDPDLNAHGIRGAAVRNYWQRVRDVVAPQPETASTALASYTPIERIQQYVTVSLRHSPPRHCHGSGAVVLLRDGDSNAVRADIQRIRRSAGGRHHQPEPGARDVRHARRHRAAISERRRATHHRGGVG